MKTRSWITYFRLIIWAVFLAAAIWILYLGVTPGGKASYRHDFSKPNFFISGLTPEERVGGIVCRTVSVLNKHCSQTLIGEPAYFNLRTLRNFDKAKVTLRYRRIAAKTKNPESALGQDSPDESDEMELEAGQAGTIPGIPVIELGIMADKSLKRYDLKPLNNQIIDDLAKEWHFIEQGRTVLLQRSEKYENIEDFLKQLPGQDKIAVYNFPLKIDFKIPGYKPTSSQMTLERAIRGRFGFYTYIKNEPLEFIFALSDINKDRSHDNVVVRVYGDQGRVGEFSLDGDSNDSDNGEINELGELKISIPGLPEGAYKVEVVAGDDIITRNIVTKQSKLAFISRIWLADLDSIEGKAGQSANGGSIFTDAPEVSISTVNPGSLQTVSTGNIESRISETFKQFKIRTEQPDARIEFEKSDIIIAGEGVFSFSAGALIEPDIRKVNRFFYDNTRETAYIIANYLPAAGVSEWDEAEVEFDLSGAHNEKGAYSFIISVPGLSEGQSAQILEIDRIRVDLEGKPLKDKLKSLF